MTATEPKLEPPGAGLPFFEHFMGRYWVFPRYCRKTSWDEAQALFEREGKRVLDIAATVPQEQWGTKVLVDRFPGIEDSSRFWSLAMVMEHLVIVGEVMQEAIVLLSRGITPSADVDIAAVKPLGQGAPESKAGELSNFIAEFSRKMASDVKDRGSSSTHRHPWLGPITAHQWHCLVGHHQRIHRKQAKLIAAQLTSK